MLLSISELARCSCSRGREPDDCDSGPFSGPSEFANDSGRDRRLTVSTLEVSISGPANIAILCVVGRGGGDSALPNVATLLSLEDAPPVVVYSLPVARSIEWFEERGSPLEGILECWELMLKASGHFYSIQKK